MKNPLKKSSPVAWFVLGVLVAGGTGTAFAANGGTFRLGQSNSATATTKLTNTQGTALKVISKAGTPPISVGSNSTKVPYFNADKLDGKDSTAFQPKIGSTLSFTSLSLRPGWSALPNFFGSATATPGVARTVDGIVRFRGVVSFSGGGDDRVFDLPTELIPTYPKVMAVPTGPDINGTIATTSRLACFPTGTCYLQDASGFPNTAGQGTYLDGVSFTLP